MNYQLASKKCLSTNQIQTRKYTNYACMFTKITIFSEYDAQIFGIQVLILGYFRMIFIGICAIYNLEKGYVSASRHIRSVSGLRDGTVSTQDISGHHILT